MKTEKYNITGMSCAACEAAVTRNVAKLAGIEKVEVSLLANQMTVSYDETKLDSEKIIATVTGIGYGASLKNAAAGAKREDGFRSEWEQRKERQEAERRSMKKRLVSSVCILVPLMYIAMGGMMGLPVPGIFTGTENALILALTQLLLTIPVMFLNRKFYIVGYKALWKKSPNMDSLVAIGSTAAFLYGLFAMYRMAYGYGHGDMELVHQYHHELYFESAAMILTLVTVGKYLEARSKGKTSDALGKLVELAPKTAVVLRGGTEETIPAEQVVAGDIVVIRPGESIPVDGVILEGSGYVDQAAITGESIPVEKHAGDTVISATINKNGSFRFRASKVGDDTTLAQIIRLVDEAGNSKAPIARLADRVSGIFVPVVMSIAVLTSIVWLLCGQSFEFALSSGIAVLVISCPCALGLATPVAIMVGTGKAAENGILIKSAESLENLHAVDTIVLDKTGTITSGHPSVTDIRLLENGLTEHTFLLEAASVEAGSEHPLAEAIVERAKAEGLALKKAEQFEAVSGRGVRAQIDGSEYLGGNLAFMRENGIEDREKLAESVTEALAAEGKTPLLFAKNGRLIGIVAVADTVKETSRRAISAFREMGLSVVMLTGDNQITAEAIRKELGIGEAIAGVLPTGKEEVIRSLQEKGHRVAMVGDGVNDAPALTRADIGIAIGAGTDVAIESADVVLMKDSLHDVATAIRLSKAVVKNIRMNLFWAFFYNILGIPVAAGALYPLLGIRLSPMIGSAAMSLSSVCVVTNALRLRFFRTEKIAEETAEAAGNTAAETHQAETEEGNSPAETTAGENKEKGKMMMKKVLKVDGMMCPHCQAHVRDALSALSGVVSAEVSLENKEAVVELSEEVSDETLKAAVKEAGYEPGACSML